MGQTIRIISRHRGNHTFARAASEVLSREVARPGIKVKLIEPGSFRTDWGGSSMSITEPSEDYRSTLEGRLEYHNQAGNEPGDPAKAAQAIMTIVNAEIERRQRVCLTSSPRGLLQDVHA